MERDATAEVVIACAELEPSLSFYQRLGFSLELITPADAPTAAVVAGFGLRLRLDAAPQHDGDSSGPVRLRLATDRSVADRLGPRAVGPEGTVVDVVVADDNPTLPPASPTFELSRFDPAEFGVGRASMAYRDLLPSRQGGRYVASHIQIAEGGPVPDYVHYHRIIFQLIYCRRGWVRVVYEDQGPPFVLEPGDCVLQPPGIRHRVLEASDGLEVVEVGCPAVHDTLTDPALELPNTPVAPDRIFGRQRFVRHVAADATPTIEDDGFSSRDLGLGAATDGLASVRVIRSNGRPTSPLAAPTDSDFYFLFVDNGVGSLRFPDGPDAELGPGDAAALPAGAGHALASCSPDFEALELTVRHPSR